VKHPFSNVAIVAVNNSEQARSLPDHDSYSITLEAALGAIELAGVARSDIDGVYSQHSGRLIYELGLGPAWEQPTRGDFVGVLGAASAITTGLADVVLLADGGAGIYTDRAAVAPWLQPVAEFMQPFGLYTGVEYALVARRHMEMFGTKPEHLAEVASTIRNNGHVNPEAVYYGRGPYTPEDILNSRMITEPFHLLDCAMTSEGGTAVIMTTVERALDLDATPVYILGGGADRMGPPNVYAPTWELFGRSEQLPNGYVGRRAARKAFAMADCGPADIGCCEFYDPFSFEIIRQFEAFEFCGPGEGGPFVMGGTIAPSGRYPITTDGGLQSYSHGGGAVQVLQRVVRGVQQLQHRCTSNQLENPGIVMCSAGGPGGLYCDVVLLSGEQR
jgi:acetyl-CoA acetyltransferase